jgi:hypothetical protein
MTVDEFKKLRKKGFFQAPHPEKRCHAPQLILPKRITGTWGVDVGFWDNYPKVFNGPRPDKFDAVPVQ